MPLSPIEKFIADLRANPTAAPIADEIAAALAAVDIEADGNPHALQFNAGVEWILGHQEKLGQISRLCELQGSVTVKMREFTGWCE